MTGAESAVMAPPTVRSPSIAQWFALHGYADLFRENRAVIGDNPDLIFPGQRITITRGTMTVR